jgi:hypothetical protein
MKLLLIDSCSISHLEGRKKMDGNKNKQNEKKRERINLNP